ncbi:MAG: hypothetical protein LBS99_05145 [Clostridiales bacterium]|jgi:hypothetical protein|nr:hypothetical protein [Clostridiales bacterium]
MKTYPETLREIAVLSSGEDVKVLAAANKTLESLFAADGLNEDNKTLALILTYRLQMRIAAIRYRDALSPELYERCQKLCAKILVQNPPPLARDEAEQLMLQIDATEVGRRALAEAASRDLVTATQCVALIAELDGAGTLARLNLETVPFYRDALLAELARIRGKTVKARQRILEAKFGSVYNAFRVSLADYGKYNYYSALLDNAAANAKVQVICSPFREEIDFLCQRFSRRNKKELFTADVGALSAADTDAVDYCFERLALDSSDGYFYLFGLTDLTGNQKNLDCLHRNIARLSMTAERIILADTSAAHTVFTALTDWAAADTEYDGLDSKLNYGYLAVPDYPSVTELMQAAKLLETPADTDFMRHNCPTLGFIGLNELLINYKTWRSKAEYFHKRNKAAFDRFARDMPNLNMLIDSGWDYQCELSKTPPKPRKEFDYDTIDIFRPENLRAIIERPGIPLTAKCGLAVQYCALLGDDASVWKDIPESEKEERVETACKVLGRILETYDPEVLYTDKPDCKYAGQCCGGGKTIEFTRKTLNGDVSFLTDVIAHEMYHSFQHKTTREPWQDWFFTELQVSRHRIEQWHLNFGTYIELEKNRKSYLVQVVETDANIFAADTKDGCADYRHELNFTKKGG